MARKKPVAAAEKLLTISQIARKFGLARSTLLYYDRTGLLKPHLYTQAGYRLYDERACERLTRIVELRSAGLALDAIKRILTTNTPLAEALERQVAAINQQMAQLRERQRVVLSMLERRATGARARTLSKAAWTHMFRDIGLSDADMRRWHASFEHSMPEAHQEFLESLGIGAMEIRRIRASSARAMHETSKEEDRSGLTDAPSGPTASHGAG